jgi:hypothetical protein
MQLQQAEPAALRFHSALAVIRVRKNANCIYCMYVQGSK